MISEIRLLNQENVPEVTQIEQVCFNTPWTEKMIADEISQETVKAYGYFQDQRLTGFLFLRIVLDEATVENIAVRPEFRQQGIGFSLIKKAVSDAEKQSVRTFYLEVRLSNTPALKLYQKMGFNITGIRKKYYQCPIEDAYLMALNLDLRDED